MKTARRQFVVCIENRGYAASLEVGKIYRLMADSKGEKRGLIRVVDESGEDYLYPADRFLPIQVSRDIEKALAT